MWGNFFFFFFTLVLERIIQTSPKKHSLMWCLRGQADWCGFWFHCLYWRQKTVHFSLTCAGNRGRCTCFRIPSSLLSPSCSYSCPFLATLCWAIRSAMDFLLSRSFGHESIGNVENCTWRMLKHSVNWKGWWIMSSLEDMCNTRLPHDAVGNRDSSQSSPAFYFLNININSSAK